MTYAIDQRRQKRAEKELAESVILTDYLLATGKNFDDIHNFSSRMVKEAIAWKHQGGGEKTTTKK